MIEVGNKAPEFQLHDTDRNQRSLKDFTGKKVLAFFPGAFTGVCEKEMCAFRDSMAELNGLDANVIGISVDAPFSNGAFAQRNNLNFPLLSDYNRDAVRSYDVAMDDFAGMAGYTAAKRSVFILDADNNVRYTWVSDNPGVEPDYNAIKEELKKF